MTVTCTPSVTFTATSTASPTVTETSTPEPILIDDYEDANLVNEVYCTDCVNDTHYFCMDPCSHIDLAGISFNDTVPSNGLYYYSVTGTASFGGDSDILLLLGAKTTSGTSTGLDASDMLYFDFDYRINASPEMKLEIKIYAFSGASLIYTMNAVSDNTWQSVSIPISSFTGTPAVVLSNIQTININTNTVASSGLSFYEEFSIDNVKFRR